MHADPTAALLSCAPQAPSPPHPCLGAREVVARLSLFKAWQAGDDFKLHIKNGFIALIISISSYFICSIFVPVACAFIAGFGFRNLRAPTVLCQWRGGWAMGVARLRGGEAHRPWGGCATAHFNFKFAAIV